MKLATVPAPDAKGAGERRDGRLALVDDAAGRVAPVPAEVAPSLRAALEDWARAEPLLRELDAQLKEGRLATTPLASARFLAPIPRTFSWLDGSAYIQHILLVRKARGVEPPEDLRTVPLMYQGVGAPLLGPRDDVPFASEDHGIDLEAEVAVLLDDVPMGLGEAEAARHIRLLLVMNDWSLRNLIPRELAAGFGFFHGKPPTSFAPYAVTPDEVGGAWRDGRLHLDMRCRVNGQQIGDPDAGRMFFSFPRLVQHAAATRPLPAGTILGGGTVSNEDEARGVACLAERRTIETIKSGKPSTPFLRFGDRVEVEMLQGGRSVFGKADNRVVRAGGERAAGPGTG